MPRKDLGPDTISYNSTELALSVLKVLMLRSGEEGYTTAELGKLLCVNTDRVGRTLKLLHEEYGLIWISGWKRFAGQQSGATAKCFSISTAGPFMHADRPKPVAAFGTENFIRFMYTVPRVNAKWPEVADHIKRCTKNGKMPTYAEIAAATGASAPTIAKARAYLLAQQQQALSNTRKLQ